jgi:putative ATP-binding cassette transporter
MNVYSDHSAIMNSEDPGSIPDQGALVSRFWRSASGFWRSPIAICLLLFLITTLLLQLIVQYQMNFWNRDFFNAVAGKNETEIWNQALPIVPIAAGSLALALASVWGRMTTKRKWREWLSKRLYDYWLELGHEHQLQFMPGEHQTPEYRIAEDAKVATDLPIDLMLGLLWSLLSAVTFIGVLWTIGGDINLSISGHQFYIPKYLVIAVVIYSIIVTVATMTISRRLTETLGESKRTEAELRSTGAYLRESGERRPASDQQGDGRFVIGQALDQVIAKSLMLCWQNMRMTLVAHSNFILTPVIALLLCMPKYLEGAMSLGEVIQVTAAFIFVQTAFNWITDSYGNIAEWISSASRVASLLVVLDQIGENK